jgi:DNA invertase Pin-like site-specific DNA recombinase
MSKRVKNGSPIVAVAYVRVSKDDQKLGPEAQRASIEAWAAREGVRVAAWHVDQGVCSVTPIDGRPALVAALGSLREHGAGVLVVAKRDRISRDPDLTATVTQAARVAGGAAIVSAAGEGNGDSASDLFLRRILDAKAELERADIRSRTKAALAVIRARGQKTGGSVPYGYRLGTDGRTLVVVESEQATVAAARALSAEGRSLRAVAAQLASEGRVSRKGKAFSACQVRNMLALVEGQRAA